MTDIAKIAEGLSEALKIEEAILAELDSAYQRGEIEYLVYSPARDITAARAAALSFALQKHLMEQEG